eukprot:scaffold300787_cov28-Tisochrysis_lutea.AAC.1
MKSTLERCSPIFTENNKGRLTMDNGRPMPHRKTRLNRAPPPLPLSRTSTYHTDHPLLYN